MQVDNGPASQYGWINQSCLFHSYNIEDIGIFLPEEKIFRFVFFIWHIEDYQINQWYLQAIQRRPQHKFFFLCNDDAQSTALQSLGLNTFHISLNAFLDERVYKTVSSNHTHKRYDAVYIARLNRFKRHYLMKDIPSSLIIGAPVIGDGWVEGDGDDYLNELIELMPNAEFTYPKKNSLPTSLIVRALHESHVGVILSELEGGSYVTLEYLLCGLPVVSTPSKGGRDCWLHPKYSRIVSADSASVAAAVNELKSSEISPLEIRSFALNVIFEHRQRFFKLGQSTYEEQEIGQDFARDFYTNFKHKMAGWYLNKEVMDIWRKEFFRT